MQLVELIPTAATESQVLDQLETFATTNLGKGVIRAKDTPNFVANRDFNTATSTNAYYCGKSNEHAKTVSYWHTNTNAHGDSYCLKSRS